jgi:hypothetical protein
VLLVPHVLVSVLCLVEGEDLFVDDGLDVVCFDGAVHLLELQPAADQDAADGANVVLVGSQLPVALLLHGDWERNHDLPGSPGK